MRLLKNGHFIKTPLTGHIVMATASLRDKQRAIVRGIPESFPEALTSNQFSSDVELSAKAARKQQFDYIKKIESFGIEVIVLPPDQQYPDCCFVEDQAIIVDGNVLMPIVGHESRIGEQPLIATFLEKTLTLHWMEEPAKLDGGDIVRVGDNFFVGVGGRTNKEGAKQLKAFLAELGYKLKEIKLPKDILHLTSICSSPDPPHLIIPEGILKPSAFGKLPDTEIIEVPAEEMYGCNTIGFGKQVLVAKGHPVVNEMLQERGYTIHELDMSQFKAVDGSMTCLSLFF